MEEILMSPVSCEWIYTLMTMVSISKYQKVKKKYGVGKGDSFS